MFTVTLPEKNKYCTSGFQPDIEPDKVRLGNHSPMVGRDDKGESHD